MGQKSKKNKKRIINEKKLKSFLKIIELSKNEQKTK